MRSNQFICVHGHFYQPPRDNPFTEVPEGQRSAAPYINWNARITDEAYAPNAAARLLDENGELARTVNNYELISFDFGPTLLSWMETGAPETYRAIIDADSASMERFAGHGSAIAQPYNHTILPLSNRRDKATQIRWGISDFRHRFGRDPQGLWFPETAVDLESMEIAARAGISFTILAPHQAAAYRDDEGAWIELHGDEIDTRVPYRVELSENLSMVVFFYNGPLSRDIAFDGMLDDGRKLARILGEALGDDGPIPRLSHVATDGETYGHHHKFGEMALAAALDQIDRTDGVELSNYARFLSLNPSIREARIREGTSWSCAHGVERWRSDCGCSTGGEPGWHQQWRLPLRTALDWLRDRAIEEFGDIGGDLFVDPWAARDAYIDVLLGGTAESLLAEHARPDLTDAEAEKALDLLEIQHRSMLMYTSCGWFFNDITGIESVFVLRHAGRLIDLTRKVTGTDLQDGFLALLSKAISNKPGVSGADLFRSEVEPYMARP